MKLVAKRLDLLRCIVDLREKSSDHQHKTCHDHAAEHTEHDHLVVCVLCFFQLAGAQILSDHDTDAGTKLQIDDVEQVCDCRRYIQSRHYLQSTDGIALV